MEERVKSKGSILRTQRNEEMWGDPDKREALSQALRASWQDPAQKKWRVSRTHSPEAEEKRIASIRKWEKDHPVEAAERGKAAYQANRETSEAYIKEHLGEDPKQALSELVKLGLSTEEITVRTGLTPAATLREMGRFGFKSRYIARLSREEIDRRHGVYYWADTFGLVQNLPDYFPVVMTELYSVGRQTVSLEDVGDNLGKSRERIRQIEIKSLKILRRKMNLMAFPSPK